MDATRARFGSAIEWALAAVAFVAVVVLVGSVMLRQVRSTDEANGSSVRTEPTRVSALPDGVPSRAVSVPVLLLPGNKEVRVGDSVSMVAERLGRQAEVGTQTVEPARFGERLTRFYEHDGIRFALVFEPSEHGGEPKIAAIYLQ